MKKLFLCILFILFSLGLYCQSPELKKFSDKQMPLIGDCFEKGDYIRAERFAQEFIERIDSSSNELVEEIEDLKCGLYYGLAVFQSEQGKIKEGASSFEKSVALNYQNYKHALNDSHLNNLRNDKRFVLAMETLRERGDFIHVLKKGGDYKSTVDTDFPDFTYLEATNPNLVRIRNYFNLDSIAGHGDEVSRIKNLLFWAHNVVRHDGNSNNPENRNAIDLVEICKKEDRGLNCRMMSQMLNECYLALGFKARYVTCLPKVYIHDCHVINIVYSETLNKWVWVDPTNNAYVMDENGMLLGIAEVRERLKRGEELVLNEDANWNNEIKTTKEEYLDQYMAKNLYYLECSIETGYNTELNLDLKFVKLSPSLELKTTEDISNTTDNPNYFWKVPN